MPARAAGAHDITLQPAGCSGRPHGRGGSRCAGFGATMRGGGGSRGTVGGGLVIFKRFRKFKFSFFLLQFATAHACASAQELQCPQPNRAPINAFADNHKFYYGESCMPLLRAIIAAPRCRGERQQRRSYSFSWHFEGQCHRCKRAGDYDSMKTASSAGSGRTCPLQPNRLWRKPAACKLPDDH